MKRFCTSTVPLHLIPFLLLTLLPAALFAQPGSVGGYVRNTEGDPLVGAVVSVKGTARATAAGVDGRFTLSGVKPGDVLLLRYMQATQEVVYDGSEELLLTMEDTLKQIEDVVVVGYGTVRREDVTGSVASVKVDDKVRAFTPNAQDLLVGRIAGVSIVNEGGAPTGNSYIRIRGGSSLSANNEPLLIVDGIYVDSQSINGAGNILSTVNPADIETFTVLKDASATAIYGSRASNGVILITTKKGGGGRFHLSYDANVSVGTLRKKVDVLTGDEYRVMLRDTYSHLAIYDRMKERQGLVNTDWQEVIYRTTVNTAHNLSVYGTLGEKLPYRVSVGFSDIKGILKTSDSKRYTASVSLNPRLFDDHLLIDVNGHGTYAKNRYANWDAIAAAIAMDPTQPVYDKDSPYGGFFTWLGDDHKIIQVATKNPLSILEMQEDRADVYNFKGNARLDYKLHFLPDLRINVNVSIDASKSDGRKYFSENSPADYMAGGYDARWEQKIRNTLLNAYLKYDRELGAHGSRIDLMAGYEWQRYWRAGSTVGRRITAYDRYGEPILVEDSRYEAEHYLVSFFGRLNYNFRQRYLLTFTLRDDGSSRFAKKNRWALFPSVALAWRISEEKFMRNAAWVGNLKLRLGWGITGQQEIHIDYGHLRTYLQSVGDEASYLRGTQNGEPVWSSLLRPESYNPDLKWESTVTLNAGLDFSLFRGRLDGSVDFYHRRTEDLINLQTKTTAGTNFSEYVATNIGNLENVGFELALTAYPVSRKNLRWSIGANLAFNRNRITRLTAGDDRGIRLQNGMTVNMVGQAANMYYVYEQVYDDRGKPVEGLYVDRNNDGEIDARDLRPYKNGTPAWTLGLNTQLVWRSWDLTVSGHGGFGNYNYNAIAANGAALSPTSVYTSETLTNRVRSAFDTNFQIAQPLSDYYVQNASFFRVDNIVLGWSFRKSDAFPLGGRIYASVQNAFVFTAYEGVDPEVFGGIDGALYPRPLTVTLGLNLNF